MTNSFLKNDDDDDDDYDKNGSYESDDDNDDYYDFEDDDDDDEDDDENSYKELATFFCNDCNYRWQKHLSKKIKEDDYDDKYGNDYYNPDNCCPMCGSSTIDRV